MSEFKSYRHASTGLVEDYPADMAALFPDLIEFDSTAPAVELPVTFIDPAFGSAAPVVTTDLKVK